MIKTGYFLIKKNTQKKTIINFKFISDELCWYTRFHDRMSIWWSLDVKKPFDFKLMLQILKLTFSPTPPSLNALLRSPCQAVTMTTSENVILYDLRTHGTIKTD